jgi:hypothetical protein
MTNHAHVVLETPRTNLDRFMHGLETAYGVTGGRCAKSEPLSAAGITDRSAWSSNASKSKPRTAARWQRHAANLPEC